MTPPRAALLDVHERYLGCCDDRRHDELGEFVAADVTGSGPVDGLAAYAEGVTAITDGFPDHRWEPQQVLVDGDTVAVRLRGRGTHRGPFCGVAATGRAVDVQELVVHRFRDGRIAECWGDLFPVLRDALAG